MNQREQEIEAREKAATPGPWYWKPESGGDFPQGDHWLYSSSAKMVVDAVERYPTVYAMPSRGDRVAYDRPVVTSWGYDADGIEVENPADEEFIAHAREDIPYLLKTIAALREELGR